MNFKVLDKSYLIEHMHTFLDLINGWKYSSWKETNFLYEVPRKWELSFVALEQEKIVGFCVASNKISSAYYIHLIFLTETIRGKNIGTKMIKHASDIALSKGLKRIELRCPESNKGGLQFYNKAGFTVKQVLKDQISGEEADYYLVKNL